MLPVVARNKSNTTFISKPPTPLEEVMQTVSTDKQSLSTATVALSIELQTPSSPTDVRKLNMHATAHDVENELNANIVLRDQLRGENERAEAVLSELFASKGTKRPRESVAEIVTQIDALEKRRETTSMSLNDEKDILKQIYRLNKVKADAAEFVANDKSVKETKASISRNRDRIRELGVAIATLKIELENFKVAESLGCNVSDLVVRKITCPTDKIGQVIGKNGKKLTDLMEKSKVGISVKMRKDDEDGNIHLIGRVKSLDEAMSTIDKALSKIEVIIQVSENFVSYLSCKNITALNDIRRLFIDSDTYCTVVRGKKNEIKIKGIPEVIETAKKRFAKVDESLIKKTLTVTAKESLLIVGKQGSIIDKVVEDHQVVINIIRNEESQENLVCILGEEKNVTEVLSLIENQIKTSKETDATVPVDSNIKGALLSNFGKGIKQLQKKVADAVKDELLDAYGSVPHLTMSRKGIVIKGKTRLLPTAVRVVQDEVQHLAMIGVTIPVDSIVIPVLVGKGGDYINQLKDTYATVSVHIDRDIGQVQINGLEKDDIEKVRNEIQQSIDENTVTRIDVVTSSFTELYRDLTRAHHKEIRALAFMLSDEIKSQIILRGEPVKVEQAAAIVQTFLERNYSEEFQISEQDISSLLAGGKQSKIAEIATSRGIQLRSDPTMHVVRGKGPMHEVKKALDDVRQFLYGGKGIEVVNVELDDETMSIVMGRGGKNKKELEANFDKLSILHPRAGNFLTLRGPPADIKACQRQISHRLVSATISRTIPLNTSKKVDEIVYKKKIMKEGVPINLTFTSGDVTFRGTIDNVECAKTLWKEMTDEVYECNVCPGLGLYQRLKDACRDPSHLGRIGKECDVTISCNDDKRAVFISGSRSKVKLAKTALLKFFDFLYGGQFASVPIPTVVSIAKSSILGDVVMESGVAKITLDRDLGMVLLFDSDQSNVSEAVKVLKASISDTSERSFVIKFEEEEDFILSSFIGKKGVNVKKFRKDTGCQIDVSSDDRTVTVAAEDTNTLAAAKLLLECFIEQQRKERVHVPVSAREMINFVGTGGANIKQFLQKHDKVNVQIKKEENRITIQGPAELVIAAKEDIESWLSTRDTVEESEVKTTASSTTSSEERIRLRADQIPALIGTKGVVIQGLEKEFGCKIHIDRSKSIVSVRLGSPEKQKLAIDAIRGIINGDEGAEEIIQNYKNDSPSSVSLSGSNGNGTSINGNEIKLSKNATFSDNDDDFPSLCGDVQSPSVVSKAESSPVSSQISNPPSLLLGPSWASILNSTPRSMESSLDDCDTIESTDNLLPKSPTTPLSERTIVTAPRFPLENFKGNDSSYEISILEPSTSKFIDDMKEDSNDYSKEEEEEEKSN